MSTLIAAPPRRASGGAEAPPGAAPATPRFNLVMAVALALLVAVFVLSRWADNHDLVTDADSAPWTLLLLGAALLPGVILVVPLWRARGQGLSVRQALPAGYDLALLGVGVLLGGGLLDVLLRTLLPADTISTTCSARRRSSRRRGACSSPAGRSARWGCATEPAAGGWPGASCCRRWSRPPRC